MHNIDKIYGLTSLTLSQMEETDGGGLLVFVAGCAVGYGIGKAAKYIFS